MPPENGRSRPSRRLHRLATAVESTTLHELPMAFEWAPCPLHSAIAPSVIVTSSTPAWCIGDGEMIPGHWLDGEQVVA